MTFEKTGEVPVYSIQEKGDCRSKKKNEVFSSYRISFDVSDREWDEFPAQVDDAINFLSTNFNSLEKLILNHDIDDAYLDFPLYSRLNGDIVNQNDHLPRELIALAGKLNIGIEMGIYSTNAFDDES